MHRRTQMLNAFATLFVLLALLLPPCAPAQSRSAVTASPFSSAPYQVGERLSYTVSFSSFPTAAHVELLVTGRGTYFGREGVELRAHVETTGVVSAALYAINNDYITYVDPSTGLPFRAQQIVREGERVADAARDFNQPAGASAIPSKQTAGAFSGAFDFVSALFRLRALPLAQGATYALAVQNADTTYDAELKVTGRELLKTNVGSSNTIATQLRVRANSSADAYRLRVNFTDDARHIPVLVTAQHSAGEIRAELASAEILTAQPPAPAVASNPVNPMPGILLPPRPGIVPPLPGRAVNPNPTGTPNNAGVPAPLPDLPFAVGEQLNYNFFIGGAAQPVGSASLQVRARAKYFNRDGLLLSAAILTSPEGQRLFPVNDQINSYVDAATLLPFRTELSLLEGRRRARWTISVDQPTGNALFDDGTRVEMPLGTHDLISVFYALRSFDLSVGKRNAVSLLLNKRPRLLYIVAIKRETILLGGKQIPAVELSLTTGDPQGDRLGLRLWVSTDKRRLPLRLTAQTPLGPVRADLAIIPTTLE
ncbi:MAG: DUF3108 domain-containing protein [Acidobacteria bacterium]|nr:DUF3108 domain-containing protein [Acidobacteriota bacterium]